MKNPFLVGETIYLRPLEPDDGPTVSPWLRNVEPSGRFGSGLPVSEEAARRQMEAIARDERQVAMAIASRADDALVGMVRLHSLQPQRRSGGYRLALGPVTKGRRAAEALARETTRLVLAYAFETLNLNRVSIQVPAADEAARALYRKIGFLEEGVLRQEAWRNGRYEDVAVMAMLRQEYGQPERR